MQRVEREENGRGWGIAATWLGVGLLMLAHVLYFERRLSAIEAIVSVHSGIGIESVGDRKELRSRIGLLEGQVREGLERRIQECERRLEKHESREDRHEVSR